MLSRKNFIDQAESFLSIMHTKEFRSSLDQQKLLTKMIENYCSDCKKNNPRFSRSKFIDYINMRKFN